MTYKPLHLPKIEALPDLLFPDRLAKLGELSIFEQEQQAVEQVVRFEPTVVTDPPGLGGELSIQRTVAEAMDYQASRRAAGGF